MKPTDKELILQILSGEEQAATELVRRHEKRAFSITYRFTHNHSEAMDLVQESFLRMFRNLSLYQEKYEFSTWFYRIVTNLAINYNRRKRVLSWIPLTDFIGKGERNNLDNDIEAKIDRDDMARRLRKAIDSLPEKQRSTIMLFDLEGFSIRDTAQILGCSEGTVMSRIHYGRKRLKKLLEAFASANKPSSNRAGGDQVK